MDKQTGGKSVIEKQLLEQTKKLKYKTDWLGPGSAMTMPSHVSASRAIMENQHIGHAVNIKNAEPPLVSTGFENVLGSKSSLLEKADGNYEVLYKIEKSEYISIIIGYDHERKHWDAWKRYEFEEHSEEFATRYNNSLLDSLEPGDVIPEGTPIHTTESFDKYGNYCLGRNLNTIYLISLLVMEDGIGIMNDVDKKMQTYRQTTCSVPLADNEIMINLYGENGSYQGFPKIGQKIKNGILCVTRMIDHTKAPFSLKGRQLRVIEDNDKTFYANGRIIDINIRYNKNINELTRTALNEDLLKYYEYQQAYYRAIYDIMDRIVREAPEKGETYSDMFTIICEEAHDYIDSTAFFTDRNESVFGNMNIEFTIADTEPLMVGSKLVGRYGNKGVVSKIIPPEESWFTEDGRPIEAIVSALGFVGRLNPAQLNEHDINNRSYNCIQQMKAVDDLDEKADILYRYMKYMNSAEADDFRKYFDGLSDKQKRKFCRQVEENGIYVIQDPIENLDLFEIDKASGEFPPVWTKIVFPDGSKSMRPVICSQMYFWRLKQDPKDKYSARSRGPINPLYDLPSKSNRKKNHQASVSDVAVRFGEHEMEVLLTMCPIPEVIADYMAENSTSFQMKELMSRSYYTDAGIRTDDDDDFDPENYYYDNTETDDIGEPMTFNHIFTPDDSIGEDIFPYLENISDVKKNQQIINAYTHMLGTSLEIEYEKAPDGQMIELGGFDDLWDDLDEDDFH